MRHVPRYMLRTPADVGSVVELDEADSHHLVRIVRRHPGDEIELIDGVGGIYLAALRETGPPARVAVIERRVGPRPSGVVLWVGLTEAARLDLVVEKATELGVDEVVVISSARARRVPDAEAWDRRAARLGRVAEAAARQSGRAALPSLRGVVPFDQVIEEIPHGEGLIIDPRGDASLAQALVGPPTRGHRTHLLVGPEAGFSHEEVSAAVAGGIPSATLGPSTLRTETAAITSVVLALAARGALMPDDEPKEATSPT